MTDAGWTALAEGRWEEARRAFAAASRTDRSPEVREGASWAAWWLDDPDGVFTARESAFRSYRERGDLVGAARMAIWLAADQLDFNGAVAVANGWLRHARRLLEGSHTGSEHGWLAFHEGYLASAEGRTERALELASEAAEIGRACHVPDLEMLGLALRGAVLVACAEVEEGMGCLDEAAAAAVAGDATIAISGAWTCCFLVSACEAVRDYPRAFAWCDRIAEFSERYGSRYMLGFCRAHYAAVHLWRGAWDRAELELEAALEAYARSRPAFVGGVRVALAELRRRQGRWEDAERLLGEARGDAALLCGGRLALDRGDAPRAVRLAERVLRRMPRERALDRALPLEILVRGHARKGDLTEAQAAQEELGAVASKIGSAPLLAASEVAAGVVNAAAGRHEVAVRHLDDAVDRFVVCGAPFEAAQARLEAAASLRALGRAAAAAREARASLEALEALGAEHEARRAHDLLGTSMREPPLPVLTPREREVVGLVAEGLTNRQIAERLVMSEHTAHRHVTNILRKLEVPSRAAAAALAARSGLVGP